MPPRAASPNGDTPSPLHGEMPEEGGGPAHTASQMEWGFQIPRIGRNRRRGVLLPTGTSQTGPAINTARETAGSRKSAP